jgi:uncharacterized protein (TIGR03437 family)
MRLWGLLIVSLFCAHAQQLEFLNQKTAGRAVRDSQGNWIFAEPFNGDIRIRKTSPDFTQTVFDITTGGSARDDIAALQVDSNGNAYVIGVTASTDFPTTPNALYPAAGDSLGRSYFLKVDPSGRIATSTYLLVPKGTLLAGDFVAASNGDWIVAASAASAEGTLRLLRLNQDGSALLGGRWLDIGAQPVVAALRSDPSGNLFVAGSTSSDDFPATPGAFGQKRLSGTCYTASFFAVPYPCNTGFVMKFDGSDFHTIAASYLGGTQANTIIDLAVDSQGSPYLTGGTARFTHVPGDYPVTPGAFQTTYSGIGVPFAATLPFVTKMSPDLTALAYSTFLAGTMNENALAIAVDSSGRALISGGTSSRDFPATGVFTMPCGPQDPNFPVNGFITRLSADGSSLDASALLDAEGRIQFLESGDPVVTSGSDLLRAHMSPPPGPAARCTVNGANYRREGFLAPGQLVTVFGGPFSGATRLLFDGVPAPLLYAGPSQINAVVPQGAAGRAASLMEIEVEGVRSNARQFDLLSANPSVKIWIAPDGSVDNRGNLLADVALSDGTPNTEDNPAHTGEIVTIFTSGIDLTQPIGMRLNFTDVPVLQVHKRPDTFGSVVGIDVQIPGPAGGMYVISIQNGSAHTADNAGFVWTR